jgi:hypothetical protein
VTLLPAPLFQMLAKISVGAGLPAMAAAQLPWLCETYRYRQQASSYKSVVTGLHFKCWRKSL